MPTALENRIEAQKRKIAVLDDRIGRMMSRRVSEEDKLGELYAQQAKIARKPEQGPVMIVDSRGTHPSALDRAVEEQAAYYRRSS